MILIFMLLVIISVVYTILTINTIYSVCSLAIAFINISAIYLLLGFDYLALTILIIYVGAIAILFLFIIMLLNIKIIEINLLKFKNQLPYSIILIMIFFIQLYTILYNLYNINVEENDIKVINLNFTEYLYFSQINIKNLNIFGNLIYTTFHFFLIMSSLVLLLSMIAAILLTYKKKTKVYYQAITLQIYRDINKNIKQVK